MQRIRKNDDVVIIAGKNKGMRGRVLKVLTDKNRVLVEGVNVVSCHVKPDPRSGKPGGIQQQERPLHLSNVALYNPVNAKADRIGIRVLEDGRKVRYYKSDNEVVDVV